MASHSIPGAGVLNFHVKNINASVYIAQLAGQTTESLLWELFIRCGPIHTVSIHRDKALGTHLGGATIEFKSVKDANYATVIMNGIKLYGRVMSVTKSQSATSNTGNAGYVDPTTTSYDGLVTLHVGNLAPDVTEYDFTSIFSKFGPILRVNIITDSTTGAKLGYAFVTYNSFEAGDLAVARMHNQFVANRQITVQYGIKNNDTGERYGNPSDRLLLAKAEQNSILVLQQNNENRQVESHEENTGPQQQQQGQQQQGQQQQRYQQSNPRQNNPSVDLSMMGGMGGNNTAMGANMNNNSSIGNVMGSTLPAPIGTMGPMGSIPIPQPPGQNTTEMGMMMPPPPMMGMMGGQMGMMPMMQPSPQQQLMMGGMAGILPMQQQQYGQPNATSFAMMMQSQQMGMMPPQQQGFMNNSNNNNNRQGGPGYNNNNHNNNNYRGNNR